VGLDRMEQGAVVQVHVNHRLARALHRLLDRDRNFARLAVAESDPAFAVANHGQRGKAHLATALDGLRDAIDRDQFLEETVAAVTIIAGCCHVSPHAALALRTSACGWAAWSCGIAVIRDWGFGRSGSGFFESPIPNPECRLSELQSR